MLPRLLKACLAALVVFAVQPLVMPSRAAAAIPGSYYSHGVWGMEYGGFGKPGATAVDAVGNVYVADTEHDRVLKLGSSGQVLAAWGSYGTGEGQFDYPEGIAVAPNGRVIVADTNNNRVQVFDADGTFLTQWTTAGGVALNKPTGVAVDAANVAYVTDRVNGRVVKYTTAGVATVVGGPGNQNGQFNGPRGIAVDATHIYVADSGNHRMQRLTLAGAYATQWGPVTLGDTTKSRYTNLQGVARRPDGTLVVVAAGGIWHNPHNESLGRYYVEQCGVTGGISNRWGTLGTGLGQYTGIAGVAAGPGNVMYVADSGNDRIQALTSAGVATAAWTGVGSGDGEFDKPRGAAQGPDGSVYVADTGNNRIQVMSSAGTYLSQWSGPTGLSTPTDVAFDASGTVWVVEQGASKVSRFDVDGNSLGTIGAGNLTAPQGVAVDSAGDIWVADTGGGRLVRFSSAGVLLQTIKPAVGSPGELSEPTDVALDSSGRIWTVDRDRHRAFAFAANGDYDSTIGSYGTGTGQFVQPTGIAIGASGQVYVSDTGNHRLQRFTSAGAHESTIGRRGGGVGELRYPARPAVLSDGRLLVTERGNHRLQPFSYDGTAPVSSAVVVPSGWTNQVPVTVTINVTEAGSGVAATYYRIGNSGAYSLYGEPLKVSIEGTTRVWFYSVDRAGNTEAAKSVFVYIDTTPPSGTFALDGGASYTATTAVTANSSVTGASYMRFDTGSGYGAWVWIATEHPLVLPGEGVREVRAQYQDNVGNILSLTDTITVDWTPPVTLAPVLTGEWASGTVEVELQATDNASGVEATYYRTGGEGAFATYGGTFDITAQGETLVEWYSVDRAGHVETTHSATARIDSIPPQGTLAVAGGAAFVATTTVEAVSEFDDAVQMRFDAGGGYDDWRAFETTVALELPGAGPRTVRAQYADWLGNVSTYETSLTVDLAPPETVALGVSEGWVGQPVTVTLQAADDYSGVAATYYRIGEEGAFSLYLEPLEIADEGETVVQFWSVDVVNNAEETRTITARIDLTPPIGTMSLAGGESYVTTSAVSLESSVTGATRMRLDTGEGFGEWRSYASALVLELAQDVYDVTVQYGDEVEDPARVLVREGAITVDWEPPVTGISGIPAHWATGTVTVELEPTDNVSGVAVTYYRLGGTGDFEEYEGTFDITAQGETLVEWFSIDRAGNVEALASDAVRIDSIPPQGTLTVAEDAAFVATATVEAVSDFDDALQMRFDVGGGFDEWRAFETTVTLEFPGAGPRTVRAQYADWLGNVSTHETSLTVDLAPPETIALGVPGVWVAEPVTVTLQATDDYSGVTATYYRIGEEGAFSLYLEPLEIADEGETVVYFRSVDGVANAEDTQTVTVRIDMTLPYGTMRLADGDEYSTTSTVSVHSSVAGATQMRIDAGEGYGGWVSFDPTSTVQLAQGVREVTVQYRDEVEDTGRWLTLSDTITVDWEPPVTLAPVLAGEWSTGTVTVTLEATDTVSGIAETYYRLGSQGAFELYSSPFDITQEGETLVEWFSVDRAGNVEDVSFATARIDLPPGAPGGLRATAVGRDWAELEWEPLALDDIDFYTLWRATSPDGPWTSLGQVEPPESEMRVEGLEPGVEYLFRVTARDLLGSVGPTSEPLAITPGIALSRVAGSNRYRTAVTVSSAYFDAADDVVLATGEAFADALGASSLAGALDAPVLITESAGLSPGVLDEIVRLGANRVVIAGGTRAIAPAVEQALRAAGLETVRFGGENRYETAALLAAETVRVRPDSPAPGAVLIVRGDDFADALAVAPVAYAGRIPVLLVRTEALPTVTAAAIAAGGFDRAIVVGGTAAVSDQVVGALGIASERVSGANRYATAAAFALWAEAESLASFADVGITTGRAFPDALGGGAALGSRGGVVLLTTPDVLAPAARDALVARADRIERVAVLGGERAIEPAVMEQAADAIR